MLKHLAIENFKCYEGRYEFNFPGLTYLTGANNSGKSTVIQALYMLAKSNTRNADASLLLNTDSYHFGNYTNVLNKNCSNKDNIIFDIEYDKFSLQAEYDRNENVNFNPVLKYLEVDFFPTKNCNYSFNFVKDDSEKKYENYNCYIKQNKKGRKWDTTIAGFTPLVMNKSFIDKFKNFKHILDWQFFFSKISTSNIKYLRAYREDPKIFYTTYGVSLDDIGTSGEYTAEVIYKMNEAQKTVCFQSEELFINELQKWFKKIIGLNYSLEVESPENVLKMNIVENLEKIQKYDITEVGFGFSQIVPIITMILLSKKGDVLLIENPEVHLHPKLQANLAELFIYATKYGRKLIIETHSEHIINRTRLLIKQEESFKDLNNQINIYFFEKIFENNNTFIKNEEITIDKSGKLSNWPKDFFDQYYYDGLNLIK